MTKLDAEACNALTAQLQTWRQGDCFVGEFWFITRIDPDGVLTDDALPAAADAGDNSETEELGFMVVTQTCDLVRDCSKRPFVEISPLVKIDSDSDFANRKYQARPCVAIRIHSRLGEPTSGCRSRPHNDCGKDDSLRPHSNTRLHNGY